MGSKDFKMCVVGTRILNIHPLSQCSYSTSQQIVQVTIQMNVCYIQWCLLKRQASKI